MKLKKQYMKILIIFVLILFLSAYITIEVQSSVALSLGIALKVTAVILTSMGVINVINNNGGITDFFSGFVNFMETKKNITDTTTQLFNIGVGAIYNNAKMQVGNFANHIKSYYQSWVDALNVNAPTLDNVYDNYVLNWNSTTLKMHSSMNWDDYADSTASLIKTIPISDEYEYRVYTSMYPDKTYVRAGIYYIDAHSFDFLPNNGGYIIFDTPGCVDFGKFDLQVQFAENVVQANLDMVIFATNRRIQDSQSISLEMDIAGIDFDIDKYVPITGDVASVPSSLSLPHHLDRSISADVGLTYDDMLQNISAQNIDDFTNALDRVGKNYVDAIDATNVVPQIDTLVDGQVIGNTIVADVVVPELEFIGEQTGIQTGLLGNIWGWLQNLFAPATQEIDFSPLQNLVIKEKFPFSIPWDLKKAFSQFAGSGQAPQFILPFKNMPLVGGVNYTIDFNIFNKWANIMRWGILILFNIGLIILTRLLIGQ